jgi:hypothetical protein
VTVGKAAKDFASEVKNRISSECAGDTSTEAVERIEILGEYVDERYRKEMKKGGATHEKAIAAVNKDLPVAKELVKQNQELEKDKTPISARTPDLSKKPQTSVANGSIDLMLKTWLSKDADDAKIKAAKMLLLLKAADYAQHKTPEKLNTFQKALNKLQAISSSATNGLATIFGAPQQAEAVQYVVPVVADALIFLAENPDFFQRAFAQVGSFFTLCNELGNVHNRRANVPKAKAPSAHTAARTSGGGRAPQMEPGDNEKKRKSDTHEGQRDFIERQKASGEWENCKEWHNTCKSRDGNYRFSWTIEKWEFEVYKKVRGGWKHIGIMRPSEGKILTEFAKGKVIK